MAGRYNEVMISVVIPALNEEKYLPPCLDSLKKQEYNGQVEIIIADNGSTDKTADIAADYGAVVVHCREVKSVFYARQIGADFAHGDIIAQADADTTYPENWLSIIASRLENNPKAVGITGRYVYSKAPWWAFVEYTTRQVLNWGAMFAFRRPLVISGATFAFKRQTFIALGGYHDITYAPDQWGIAGRLSKAGRILYDVRLRVVTSPRSVNKPLARIAKEGFVNWGRWSKHTLTALFSRNQKNEKKPESAGNSTGSSC